LSLLADDNAANLDALTEARACGLAEPFRFCGSSALLVGPRLEIHDEAVPALSTGISNLRYKGESRPTLGTVGFYAMVNGPRSGQLVLVSSRHVLLAAGGVRGNSIYRCDKNPHGTVEATCDLDPIADVFDEGAEENYSFAYPGEDAADYFIDCATARILHPDSIPPGDHRARRLARVHPLDVAGGRSYRVRKIGNATGLTEGGVVDAAATVRSGGISRARNLVIRGVGGCFAEPGDSGALIVNDHDDAVGLLWGHDDNDPEIAYGCHIHPVLDRLGVTMLTRGMP
jgi:hypothetical protein